MNKVGDLFYFIIKGLADKSLTMDMPVIVDYDGGFGSDSMIDIVSNGNELVIISGYEGMIEWLYNIYYLILKARINPRFIYILHY